MEKYFEINKNNQNIRCKLYFDKQYAISKVILFVHGFAGHKDNSSAQKFAARILNKYKGIALLVFNLPCHGDDVKKKIDLNDCMDYMKLVISYINEQWNNPCLYAYATSFGGYLVLNYIKEFDNPFKKIVLRSPAVNMAETLTNTIITESELEQIEKGKIISVGFDRKVGVNKQFLSDLEKNDIQQLDYLEFAEDILILHGTKDEIVQFKTAQNFAENNLITFITVENADHRFQSLSMIEFATKKILEFLSL